MLTNYNNIVGFWLIVSQYFGNQPLINIAAKAAFGSQQNQQFLGIQFGGLSTAAKMEQRINSYLSINTPKFVEKFLATLYLVLNLRNMQTGNAFKGTG